MNKLQLCKLLNEQGDGITYYYENVNRVFNGKNCSNNYIMAIEKLFGMKEGSLLKFHRGEKLVNNKKEKEQEIKEAKTKLGVE